MAKLTAVWSTIVVTFAVIGSCMAIECYVCTTNSGQCEDPFTGNIKKTCKDNDTMCIATFDRGTKRYVRDCETAWCNQPNGCIVRPGRKGQCSYCCDSNLCNNRSVEDEVAGVLNCYSCTYKKGDSDASCADPLGAGKGLVKTVPCDDPCSIDYKLSPSSDFDNIERECKPNCVPACDSSNSSCTTCCTDDLCNGGSPTATQMPPTPTAQEVQVNTNQEVPLNTSQEVPLNTSQEVPRTTSQGVVLTASLAFLLLVFLGLYQTVFVACQ